MIDELFGDFRQTYPSFQAYSAKQTTGAQEAIDEPQRLSLAKDNNEDSQLEIIVDPESKTTPQKMQPVRATPADVPMQVESVEGSKNIVELSYEEDEGEGENDQEINVILEERSNDFSNRK